MISSVEIHRFETALPMPLTNPITPGNEIVTLLTRLMVSDGCVGLGYGWAIGKVRGNMIEQSIRWAAEFLVRQDERRREALWDTYLKTLNFTGTTALGVIGMSVCDMALWDIAAKRAGMPLAELLGGHKTHAPLYRNLISEDYTGAVPAEELAEVVRESHAAGSFAFKLRFGLQPLDADVARIKALSGLVPSDVTFAVDVAQRWTTAQALRGGQALDDLGLDWIEDPVSAEDLATHARLADRLITPICTGENVYLPRQAHDLLEQARPGVLMMDLQRCGGISGWIKSSSLAEVRGVSVTPHTYPHVGVHLVAGTRNGSVAEHVTWWDELFGPIEVVDGCAEVPPVAGIGLDAVTDRLGSANSHSVIN